MRRSFAGGRERTEAGEVLAHLVLGAQAPRADVYLLTQAVDQDRRPLNVGSPGALGVTL